MSFYKPGQAALSFYRHHLLSNAFLKTVLQFFKTMVTLYGYIDGYRRCSECNPVPCPQFFLSTFPSFLFFCFCWLRCVYTKQKNFILIFHTNVFKVINSLSLSFLFIRFSQKNSELIFECLEKPFMRLLSNHAFRVSMSSQPSITRQAFNISLLFFLLTVPNIQKNCMGYN